MGATPYTGASHVGDGDEVDNVAEELIVAEVEDSSEDVEVIISSEEVEVEDSSEDVEVTISSEDVEVERSLEVVVVASPSSRSSTSTDEVTGSEVDVVTISVVLG